MCTSRFTRKMSIKNQMIVYFIVTTVVIQLIIFLIILYNLGQIQNQTIDQIRRAVEKRTVRNMVYVAKERSMVLYTRITNFQGLANTLSYAVEYLSLIHI
eukprot:TRINITY_DN5031_c0_g1_i10.p3 TRINITY_DN5031_c0_g1~~TRINITY_DN5031_c0_g1_i10.p3  ORF type:complete len:100 (+),score=30.16 TRINITY_DN5031_c0_g1_i10:137-436(+)